MTTIMKSRIIVVGLIKKDSKVLLGQKPPGVGPYPNTWHIPDGGVNLEEENCEEAILREIREETGLEVKNLKKVAWDTDVELDKQGEPTYYIFLQFSCDYESGKLTPGDDMHRFEWVEINNLSNYNLNKPTRILLEKLGYIK